MARNTNTEKVIGQKIAPVGKKEETHVVAQVAPKKKSSGGAAKKSLQPKTTTPKVVSSKPASKKTTKPKAASKIELPVPVLSNDDIAKRAYFIGENRRHLGLPGDSQGDWIEAERQLRAEAIVQAHP